MVPVIKKINKYACKPVKKQKFFLISKKGKGKNVHRLMLVTWPLKQSTYTHKTWRLTHTSRH